MPEDNNSKGQLSTLNKIDDNTSTTLGIMKQQYKLDEKSVLLQEKQIADNKTAQDTAREDSMELKATLDGLKDGISFFKSNLKDLGLGGATGAFDAIATKLKAAFNLLMSPLTMIIGFVIGVGQGLKSATKMAKDGGKIVKMLSLPLLAFNKVFEVIRNSLTSASKSSNVITKTIGNMRVALKNLSATFQSAFKGTQEISKNATRMQKAIFNIGKFFSNIRTSIQGVATASGKFGELIGKLTAPFKGLVKGAAAIGRIVGRLFAPLNAIFILFETITTALERGKEGGFFAGILGAIEGFLKGLVTIPLDLLKDGVAWIIGKLGFTNVAEGLKSFSFTELLTGIFDWFIALPGKIYEFLTTHLSAAGESLTAWFTDFSTSLSEGWESFKTAIYSLPDTIVNAFRKAKNWVKNKIKRLASKLNPLNWFRSDSDDDYAGEFAEGGKIPYGKYGIVGEMGPEFVSGPATVTSTEKTASLLGTAEKLIGGTNEQREMFGAVDYTEGQGLAAMNAFNAALDSAGISARVSLDEIKAATEVGIENAEGRIADLYAQLKSSTDALDLSGGMDISLDDFDLSPTSGDRIALAEDNLADAQMERQGSTNAVMNSGNVTSSIVTSSNTITAGVNVRNSDSISYLNRSM